MLDSLLQKIGWKDLRGNWDMEELTFDIVVLSLIAGIMTAYTYANVF